MEKTQSRERLMAKEGGGGRWDDRIVSLTQWTWIWANSWRQWRTEEPGSCSPRGHKERDMTYWLNSSNRMGLPWWASGWLPALNAAGPGANPRGPDPTGHSWIFHMPQRRSKALPASTKTQHNQINKQQKKKGPNLCLSSLSLSLSLCLSVFLSVYTRNTCMQVHITHMHTYDKYQVYF